MSTLVGIAIDKGLIGSVDDPVTDYLPELAARDPGFRQITLRHLLTMSSGIRYQEGGGFPWPFGDDTYTYYGVDLRDLALTRVQIEAPPGLAWQYNNYHPLLLGLVLERATGTSVSTSWPGGSGNRWEPKPTPPGTSTPSAPGSRRWRAASTQGRSTTPASACSSSTTASGTADGSSPRTGCARRPAPTRPPTRRYYYGYRYFWWRDVDRPGRFYAQGKYGQYIYVAPDADAVIVRFGRDWGVGNITWLATLRDIADQLERRP